MDRTVHEHYPVEKLPADLRPRLGATHVRIVVEPEMSDDEILAELDRKVQLGLDQLDAGLGIPAEEVVARIKARSARMPDAAE